MPLKNASNNISNAFTWIKRIFLIIALCFLFYFSWSSWDLLTNLYANANSYLIITCIAIWIVLHFLSPFFTTSSLSAFNSPLNYKVALYIHVSQLPSKYIPGGIWHSVARSINYSQVGISKETIGIYFLHENILVASITLFTGGMLLSISNTSIAYLNYILFISVCSAVFITLWPKILKHLPNKFQININIKHYIKAVISIALFWIVASASFIIFLSSFSEIELSFSIFYTAGAYIFSWGVGFITLIAPQGIGISEVVASQLLQNAIDTKTFVALLASYRIIILAADLIMWVMSFILKPEELNRTITQS